MVPYLSTGATDNARLRRAGIATYGILPFPLAPADEARMHGHDERVSVDGLAFGLRVVFGAVARLVDALTTTGPGVRANTWSAHSASVDRRRTKRKRIIGHPTSKRFPRSSSRASRRRSCR